jgi:hypothetical protein
MDVLDLRASPPPRWNVMTDGVVWLARFAAKVRAYDAGMLGTYLLGQSPVDDEFLAAARIDYRTFIEIVRGAANAPAVLLGIESRAPGATERLRLWSTEMPVRRRLHMHVLDLDDGVERPAWMTLPHRAFNAGIVPLVALVRALRPLKE